MLFGQFQIYTTASVTCQMYLHIKIIAYCICMVHNQVMILSFRHKGLQLLFENDNRSKVPAQDAQKLKHILVVLNRVAKPEDMRFPDFGCICLKVNLKAFGEGQCKEIKYIFSYSSSGYLCSGAIQKSSSMFKLFLSEITCVKIQNKPCKGQNHTNAMRWHFGTILRY